MTLDTVHPPKSRRWLRWGGGILVLCLGLLFHLYWSNRQSNAAVERLRKVAIVRFRETLPYSFSRYIPRPIRRMLPQTLNSVHFQSGTQDFGTHLEGIPTRGICDIIFIESNITPQELDSLTRFPYLSDIHFHQCQLADGALCHLKNLESLSFRECQLAAGTLRSLKNHPEITYVAVPKCILSSTETIDYASLPNLILLNLNWSNAGDSVLRGLADHPQITEIQLVGTAITDEGLRQIRRLPSLQKIRLGGTRVTGVGLAELDSPLTELNLAGTQANDEGLAVIARITSLERLDLARTKITVLGVSRLRRLRNLSYLILDRCDIDDEALVHLQAMPQVKRWRAVGTRMVRQTTKP